MFIDGNEPDPAQAELNCTTHQIIHDRKYAVALRSQGSASALPEELRSYFRVMKLLLMNLGLLCAVLPGMAQSTRVLFIGNSYIGVNDLPEMTRQLALSLGDTLVVQSSTPGGTTFQGHSTNPTTQALIAHRRLGPCGTAGAESDPLHPSRPSCFGMPAVRHGLGGCHPKHSPYARTVFDMT